MGKKFSKVTTSHWGAFNVFVENDRIVKTEPFHADPAPPNISELGQMLSIIQRELINPTLGRVGLKKTQIQPEGAMNLFLLAGKTQLTWLRKN